MDRRRLVAIIGPTATGKSDLAVEVARACNGEIVSADAYQVYRGLDIGTAKPPPERLRQVRHHLIDITGPADTLTLARYLDAAHAALEGIWRRAKLPVLTGGSGQYVWAVLEGWHVPRIGPDEALRGELEAFAAEQGPEALHGRLATLDPEAAQRLDPRNVRRVVRALEVVSRTGLPLAVCRTRSPLDADALILGLRCPREELHRRIDERVDTMFAGGFVAEVERLRAGGLGETMPVRSAIGYREVGAYLDGEMTLEEAVARTKTATHRLARNQGAWFKQADSRIFWLEAGPDVAAQCLTITADWLQSAA